jgi:hypothetical protein
VNRTPLAFVALLALAAPRARAEDAPIPLGKGDVVELDGSQLPEAYPGTAKATCKGTRVSAVGPEEAICERAVRFAAPAGAARLAYVFRGAPGGADIPIEVPPARAGRRTFVAPSAGTLVPPGPAQLARGAVERAASDAAARACGECTGGTGFALDRFEIVQPPSSPPEARISVRVQRAAAPAGAARR